MSTNALVSIVVLIVIILGGWYFLYGRSPSVPSTGTSTTTTEQTSDTIPFDITHSDGTITFGVPDDFGFAVNPEQILVDTTVPPCDDGFLYCLYYNGTAYASTTLETAGLAITKRADLTTERTCLDTPPEGFDATKAPDDTNSADTYSSSVFADVGDSGAGHTVSGNVYRLFVRSSNGCYNLATRISVTPAASGSAFTDANRSALMDKINSVLENILLAGKRVSFPGL